MISTVCYVWIASLLLVGTFFDARQVGWLDKVVAYYKNSLLTDMKKLPPIQIKASIERAPPGYVDSQDWNEDSVLRLMVLLRQSESSRTTFMAIRRALSPTRRGSHAMKKQSFDLFPSWAKYHPNVFYYSYESDEYEETPLYTESTTWRWNHSYYPDDDDVVVISNPVEARLPSARITVRLLRDILETRAIQARMMPSTSRITINWSKDSGPGNSSESESDISTGGGAGSTSPSDGGADNSTTGDSGNDPTTTPKPPQPTT